MVRVSKSLTHSGLRWLIPLSKPENNGLPLLTTGSASSNNLRGYLWVHLRYGLLLCQLGTYDPLLPERRSLELPRRIGQFPGRDLNPLDIQLLLRTDAVIYLFIGIFCLRGNWRRMKSCVKRLGK